jgi:hypothetical protein
LNELEDAGDEGGNQLAFSLAQDLKGMEIWIYSKAHSVWCRGKVLKDYGGLLEVDYSIDQSIFNTEMIRIRNQLVCRDHVKLYDENQQKDTFTEIYLRLYLSLL